MFTPGMYFMCSPMLDKLECWHLACNFCVVNVRQARVFAPGMYFMRSPMLDKIEC